MGEIDKKMGSWIDIPLPLMPSPEDTFAPIGQTMSKIADIQSRLGYASPYVGINAQVDNSYISSGSWGTIATGVFSWETIDRTWYFGAYITSPTPPSTTSIAVTTGYTSATIVPWDNKILLVRPAIIGGYVGCEYYVYDYVIGTGVAKSISWPYSGSSPGLFLFCPAGPTHFCVGVSYYDGTYTRYHTVVINYETNTRTLGPWTGNDSRDWRSLRACLCYPTGERCTIVEFEEGVMSDSYRQDIVSVITSGISRSEIKVPKEWIAGERGGLIFNGYKVGIWSLYTRTSTFYPVAEVVYPDSVSYATISRAYGYLTYCCMLDWDTVIGVYSGVTGYYGFRVSDGSIITGVSPGIAYYFTFWGHVFKFPDKYVTEHGNRYIHTKYGRFLGIDFTGVVLSSFALMDKMYSVTYTGTLSTVTVTWNSAKDFVIRQREDSFLRTYTFELTKPAKNVILSLEAPRGFIDAPIIKIMDEYNNVIAEAFPFTTITLPVPITKAKLEFRGTGKDWNYLAFRGYAATYF